MLNRETRERRARQVMPVLQQMVAVKKFDAFLSKLAIAIMEGTCDPGEALMALPAARKEMLAVLGNQAPDTWSSLSSDDTSPMHAALYTIAHPESIIGTNGYEVAAWVRRERNKRKVKVRSSDQKAGV